MSGSIQEQNRFKKIKDEVTANTQSLPPLSDEEFLNMTDAERIDAMNQGRLPKTESYGENYVEPTEGVADKLKAKGYEGVEDYRDQKEKKEIAEMVNRFAKPLENLMNPEINNRGSMYQMRTPTISQPQDVMSGLRQQVLAKLASRR